MKDVMKVRYTGKTEFLVLTNSKIYEVISVERKWYRIIDESGYDYLYPPEVFEIVEEWFFYSERGDINIFDWKNARNPWKMEKRRRKVWKRGKG